MTWYPEAVKMELQPESDNQSAIRPTQLIVHSLAAPWTARRTYEYWRDSSNLESHFGIGYQGDVGQYIGTGTRADANAGANRRPDGTGAVSVETASNTKSTDPWTDAQVEQIIRLGAWLHRTHGVPLRICRTHDEPGYGYHSLFPQWSTSGTSCPGAPRIKQFRTAVFPGIVAACAPAPEEEDINLTEADIDKIAAAVRWFKVDDPFKAGDEQTTLGGLWWETAARVAKIPASPAAPVLTDAQLAVLADRIASHPALAKAVAESLEGLTFRLDAGTGA